jgi:hypothetical protein
LFQLIVNNIFAEKPSSSLYPYVKTWHVSKQFAVADSVPVDSVHVNFQDANLIDRFSISNSYNGNLGSPIQSKIYFDRPADNDFIFSNAYFPYIADIHNATFYNTKTPLSNLTYTSGGTTYRKEELIKFLYTGNISKKFNFGTTLDYLEATGEYSSQSAKRFSGTLFGTYDGDHYSATAFIATNNLSHFENGGISDITDITNPKGIATKDIPTNIAGFANYKKNVMFYNQQYSIGFDRSVRVNKDSVRMEYVPVTRFAHTFRYEDARKRYYENSVETDFYKNTYQSNVLLNDTSAVQTLTNNFSASMLEEFNKLMKFGLTAFIENEIQRYCYIDNNWLNLNFESTTKVGGILSKQRGQRFKYNVLGELSLLGYKAGNVLLEGNVGGFFKLWNDSISMVANGFVRSDKPSFFLNMYQSNHFRWENDFSNIYRTQVGGTFSIPTRSFSLNVGVENVTQYVYFNENAMPTQHSGNIQVLAANLKQDFHFSKFALENNVVYQLSSEPNALPLPTLALFHNLYFNDKWFNELSVQIGVNVRYHTAYYAPSYMPAIGQFFSQSSTKIGNYPVMNAYLNFHLKRARFFIEYYHVNQLFMSGSYFSMPNYPINPAIIKTGISWNFYN